MLTHAHARLSSPRPSSPERWAAVCMSWLGGPAALDSPVRLTHPAAMLQCARQPARSRNRQAGFPACTIL